MSDVVQLAGAYLGFAAVIGGAAWAISAVVKIFQDLADDSPLDLS